MKPPVVSTVEETRQAIRTVRAAGQRIGLVPTMGALHAGHASLMRAARLETDFVVVSIFVNPLQFGPREDLQRYPRPREQDLELCDSEGVHLIFAPEPSTMYPPGFCTHVEVQGLQDTLEGASRPGHFRGVTTVVLKLFNIVQPDLAYFGQKDAQQARLIEQMVRDLDLAVTLRICSIVREPDGLALSSRNRYLDAGQRFHARVLFEALTRAQALADRGERDPQVVEAAMRAIIDGTPGAELDYAVVVDAASLRPVERLQGRLLVALAVRFGSTRLIDNLTLYL